jgi:hypothetical protein
LPRLPKAISARDVPSESAPAEPPPGVAVPGAGGGAVPIAGYEALFWPDRELGG